MLRTVVAVVAALALVSAASAGKYAPTLGSTLVDGGSYPYNTPYTISGCGYNPAYGGVTVVASSPESTAWTGRTPDGDGCISVDNFSTQGPGEYTFTAWQTVGKKTRVVAQAMIETG